jgi:hypothetical protein
MENTYEMKKMTGKKVPISFFQKCMTPFRWLDRRVDGAISFFIKHWGKSRFMLAMSKKAQMHGLEKLFHMGPKAFVYFFLFYLVRDTILYIIIPIMIARMSD